MSTIPLACPKCHEQFEVEDSALAAPPGKVALLVCPGCGRKQDGPSYVRAQERIEKRRDAEQRQLLRDEKRAAAATARRAERERKDAVREQQVATRKPETQTWWSWRVRGFRISLMVIVGILLAFVLWLVFFPILGFLVLFILLPIAVHLVDLYSMPMSSPSRFVRRSYYAEVAILKYVGVVMFAFGLISGCEASAYSKTSDGYWVAGAGLAIALFSRVLLTLLRIADATEDLRDRGNFSRK